MYLFFGKNHNKHFFPKHFQFVKNVVVPFFDADLRQIENYLF